METLLRRSDGKHNGVAPDIVIEQTYTVDIKQKQRLCGITLKPKAQTKWHYTKHVTAAVAGASRKTLVIIPNPNLKQNKVD